MDLIKQWLTTWSKSLENFLNILIKYTALYTVKESKHRGNTTFLMCYVFFKRLTVQHKPGELQSAGILFSLFEKMFIAKLPEMQSNGDRIML